MVPFAFSFSRPAGLVAALALAIPAATLPMGPAAAQGEPEFYEEPFAERQWEIGRRFDESQFRYCVDPRDADWEVADAIAESIAGALLLEPQRYVVEKELAIEDITKIYELMLEHCDVHMGFKLIPEGYGSWIALTRAYYESSYVFVTTDPDISSLADLEPGRAIGATVGTSAHIRLLSYLMALPAQQRWPAYPYGTNELALESLADGAVSVALVWAPSLWDEERKNEDYADLRIIDPDPLPPTSLGVGAVVLSNHAFLRNAIDEAIVALTADGTIAGILESFDFPATAGQ